jgi:hypothetical protein
MERESQHFSRMELGAQRRRQLKVVRKATMLLIFVAALPVLAAIQRIAPVADDPYAPLKLYDGKWDSTTTIGPKEVIRIENHCARTGLFFVCEQAVNGKTEALTVFLPVAKMVRVNGLQRTRVPQVAGTSWLLRAIAGFIPGKIRTAGKKYLGAT